MVQVNYVSAEMKDPERDLSRVIHTALPLVTCVLYCQAVLTEVSLVAANIGYFSVLPLGTINSSSTLALVEPPRC